MRVLLRLARERGLHVEWSREMGDWLRGVYEHDLRVITLNAWMDIDQQRFALAHELGHAWHEHTVEGDPHGNPNDERLADEHAASILIDPDLYARAEILRGPHPGAIADELGVHPDVVEIFQHVLRRTAPTSYTNPWGRAPWLTPQPGRKQSA